MTVSNEDALKEALIYVADCLKSGEVYKVNDDSFAKGDEANKLLESFARKIGEGGESLEKWRQWRERVRR